MENTGRILLEEGSAMVGRADFLCLKTRPLMKSVLSLTMTGHEAEPFFAGMEKQFDIAYIMEIRESGGTSPHCFAASKQGRSISLKTMAGISAAGVREVTGRPRMRSDVERAA